MKVSIKNLKPNPFRRTETYPVVREKVDSLKLSIQDTGFWNNISAREKDGHYEIACGHHRLWALQELNVEEVDIPVEDHSDHEMIKIMASENFDVWQTDMTVVRETVRTAVDYLNDPANEGVLFNIIQHPPNLETDEQKRKYVNRQIKQGVGRRLIGRFLGTMWESSKGQNLIGEALAQIRDIDKGMYREEDIQPIKSPGTMQSIRKAAKRASASPDIIKDVIKEYADEDNKMKVDEIEEKMRELRFESIVVKQPKEEKRVELDDHCSELSTQMWKFKRELQRVEPFMEKIGIQKFWNTLEELCKALKPFMAHIKKMDQYHDAIDVTPNQKGGQG